MKIILLALTCILSACGGSSMDAVSTSAAPSGSSASQTAPAVSDVVAFMGDSITAGWVLPDFTTLPTLNFGVSGQTTDQMLARFDSEVLAAGPGIVVILGGTNDLAAGYTPDEIVGNIQTMAERATANGIKVILCSVMRTVVAEVQPPWSHEYLIVELDAKILALAQEKGYLYADYYDVLLLPNGTADPSLLVDGLHPNEAGRELMWKVLQPLLGEDLGGTR